MRIAITHATTYRYDGAARVVQALRLTPPSGVSQQVVEWRVACSGGADALRYEDAFGNAVDLVTSPGLVEEVVITAMGVVETRETAGVAGFTGEAVVPEVFLRSTKLTAADAAIEALARECGRGERLPVLHGLLDRLHGEVAYDTSATTSQTTAAAAFAARRGVCQDHAHVFIAGARSLGIPARYVTGYLLVDEDTSAGAVGDAVAHHAWAEAMVPGIGWVGFDAANGQCPTERYVRLAVGLDATAAAPIRGVRHGAASERLLVTVTVREDAMGPSQQQSQQQGQQQQRQQ